MNTKTTLLTILAAGGAWITFSSYSGGAAATGLGDRTTIGCGGPGCHAGNGPATTIQLTITNSVTGQPVSNGQYTPGATYIVAISGNNSDAGKTHFGFQVSAKRGTTTNLAGTWATTPAATNTQLWTGGVEHSNKIARAGGMYVTGGLWTAPAAGVGPVRFTVALNAVNNDNSTNGDQPNIASFNFTENTSASVPTVTASDAVFFPNPATSAVTIRFGTKSASSAQAVLISPTGAVVARASFDLSATAEHTLDLAHVAPGVYWLRTVDGAGAVAVRPLTVR